MSRASLSHHFQNFNKQMNEFRDLLNKTKSPINHTPKSIGKNGNIKPGYQPSSELTKTLASPISSPGYKNSVDYKHSNPSPQRAISPIKKTNPHPKGTQTNYHQPGNKQIQTAATKNTKRYQPAPTNNYKASPVKYPAVPPSFRRTFTDNDYTEHRSGLTGIKDNDYYISKPKDYGVSPKYQVSRLSRYGSSSDDSEFTDSDTLSSSDYYSLSTSSDSYDISSSSSVYVKSPKTRNNNRNTIRRRIRYSSSDDDDDLDDISDYSVSLTYSSSGISSSSYAPQKKNKKISKKDLPEKKITHPLLSSSTPSYGDYDDDDSDEVNTTSLLNDSESSSLIDSTTSGLFSSDSSSSPLPTRKNLYNQYNNQYKNNQHNKPNNQYNQQKRANKYPLLSSSTSTGIESSTDDQFDSSSTGNVHSISLLSENTYDSSSALSSTYDKKHHHKHHENDRPLRMHHLESSSESDSVAQKTNKFSLYNHEAVSHRRMKEKLLSSSTKGSSANDDEDYSSTPSRTPTTTDITSSTGHSTSPSSIHSYPRSSGHSSPHSSERSSTADQNSSASELSSANSYSSRRSDRKEKSPTKLRSLKQQSPQKARSSFKPKQDENSEISISDFSTSTFSEEESANSKKKRKNSPRNRRQLQQPERNTSSKESEIEQELASEEEELRSSTNYDDAKSGSSVSLHPYSDSEDQNEYSHTEKAGKASDDDEDDNDDDDDTDFLEDSDDDDDDGKDKDNEADEDDSRTPTKVEIEEEDENETLGSNKGKANDRISDKHSDKASSIGKQSSAKGIPAKSKSSKGTQSHLLSEEEDNEPISEADTNSKPPLYFPVSSDSGLLRNEEEEDEVKDHISDNFDSEEESIMLSDIPKASSKSGYKPTNKNADDNTKTEDNSLQDLLEEEDEFSNILEDSAPPSSNAKAKKDELTLSEEEDDEPKSVIKEQFGHDSLEEEDNEEETLNDIDSINSDDEDDSGGVEMESVPMSSNEKKEVTERLLRAQEEAENKNSQRNINTNSPNYTNKKNRIDDDDDDDTYYKTGSSKKSSPSRFDYAQQKKRSNFFDSKEEEEEEIKAFSSSKKIFSEEEEDYIFFSSENRNSRMNSNINKAKNNNNNSPKKGSLFFSDSENVPQKNSFGDGKNLGNLSEDSSIQKLLADSIDSASQASFEDPPKADPPPRKRAPLVFAEEEDNEVLVKSDSKNKSSSINPTQTQNLNKNVNSKTDNNSKIEEDTVSENVLIGDYSLNMGSEEDDLEIDTLIEEEEEDSIIELMKLYDGKGKPPSDDEEIESPNIDEFLEKYKC